MTPQGCNYYLIVGTSDGSAMVRSSDGTDENSYTIPAGGWYGFVAPFTPEANTNWFGSGARRFLSGATVTYIKATSGTPNVVVEFSI